MGEVRGRMLTVALRYQYAVFEVSADKGLKTLGSLVKVHPNGLIEWPACGVTRIGDMKARKCILLRLR